jgi:PEP-CTERM motif-containing protein
MRLAKGIYLMGIRFRATVIAIGVLLALVLLQSPAKADSFSFSFQSIQGSGPGFGITPPGSTANGSGTFDASPQCTQNGTYGSYTVTSLQGRLTANGQSSAMGFTFGDPCMNFVSPAGLLEGITGHGIISFIADSQRWELIAVSVTNPFPFYLFDIDANTAWPITWTASPVSTPEPSTLLFLAIGLLGVMGLTLLKNRLSRQVRFVSQRGFDYGN